LTPLNALINYKAPIGDKVCRYEIRVLTVRTAFDTHGKPIVSYDEGVTWVPSDGIEQPYHQEPVRPVVSKVVLTWEKTDEE
jgi:hypothetical protein